MENNRNSPENIQSSKNLKVHLRVPLPSLGFTKLRYYGEVWQYISQIRWVVYQAKIKENFPEINNPKYLEELEKSGELKHVVDYWYKLYFPKIVEGKVYCMRYRIRELAAYFASPQFITDIPLINEEYDRIVEGKKSDSQIGTVTLYNSDLIEELVVETV